MGRNPQTVANKRHKLSKSASQAAKRSNSPGSTHDEGRPKQIAAPTSATTFSGATTPAPRPATTAADPLESRTKAIPSPAEVIVYDVAAGIKTLHRADGKVEEESFDSATLPAIKAAEPGRTQIRIVNEGNPASTGSTVIAQPQSSAAIKAGPR